MNKRRMLSRDIYKAVIIGILALFFAVMQTVGWQISMDYGSSVYQSAFFQNIGVLSGGQCLLLGGISFVVFFVMIDALFTWLNKRECAECELKEYRYIWPACTIIIFALYMIFLWGCYPGFFNYDLGNQITQVLYEDVPYNAHHPLFHTLLGGWIVALGYAVYDVDLSFGIFLYNATQMLLCAVCFGYSLKYIYGITRKKAFVIVGLLFYGICPPIVMFAMSTTKDVACFSILLVAIIVLRELYLALEEGEPVKWSRWLQAGILCSVCALLRKNIVYALVVYAVLVIFIQKKERKKQLILYAGIILTYLLVDNGLNAAYHAIPGSVNEMLCVPYQQIARLYVEEGEQAFTEEELATLSELIPPSALYSYDPVIADHVKANFNPGLEILKSNPARYISLWAKKGCEYPNVYVEAVLYNTYHAWYPGTTNLEARKNRYFDVTYWQEKIGNFHLPRLYEFYEGIAYGSYARWPVVRVLFSTGVMFWAGLVVWFWGIWKKDKSIIAVYLLVFLICGTSFLGPVADVRYYLHLFYLLPVGCVFMISGKKRML